MVSVRKFIKVLLSCVLIPAMLVGSMCPVAKGAQAVEPMQEPKQGPSLFVQADYANLDKSGSFDLSLEIGFDCSRSSYQVGQAKNVVVKAEGTNGLTPEETEIAVGDVADSQTVTVHYHYEDPEGSPHPAPDSPQVQIHITSDNCGTLDYYCFVDMQPQARVLTMYLAGTSTNLIEQEEYENIHNSANTVYQIYSGKQFDGVPVTVDYLKVEPEDGLYIDRLGYLDYLDAYDTDDNDITYIYVATHGTYDENHKPTSAIALGKEDGSYITVEELISGIDAHIKGRAVLLFDHCFSGKAVEYAASCLDPERYFAASATTSNLPSTTPFLDNELMMLAHLLDRLNQETTSSATCGDFIDASHDIGEVCKWIVQQLIAVFGLTVAFGAYENMSPNLIENVLDALFPEEYCEKYESLAMIKNALGKLAYLLYLTPAGGTAIVNKLWYLFIPQLDKIDDAIWETLFSGPWAMNIPQFYGNEDLPMVFNDADYDDHYRLPAVLKSTENVIVNPAEEPETAAADPTETAEEIEIAQEETAAEEAAKESAAEATEESVAEGAEESVVAEAVEEQEYLRQLLVGHYWSCGIQSPEVIEFFADGKCAQYSYAPDGRRYDENYTFAFIPGRAYTSAVGTYELNGDELTVYRDFEGVPLTTTYRFHDAGDPAPADEAYDVASYVAAMYDGQRYFYETGYVPGPADPILYVPAEYLGLLAEK